MFDRIADLFAPKTEETAREREDRFRVATCVLLLEVARVDEEFTQEEREGIVQILRERFSLSELDAEELMAMATKSREESVDLWHFTRQINEACSVDEKIRIMEEIWRVVCADGMLDAHEKHLARSLAKLLNLEHHQMIEAKVKILDEHRGKSAS